MKDKQLKKLMDEYAAIPRADRAKDLAKRRDDGDIVAQPVSTTRPRRRFNWRYVAVGVSFALVAAVAIPLAVVLPRSEDAEYGLNYAADMSADNGAWGSQDAPRSNTPYSEDEPNHADEATLPDDPYSMPYNGSGNMTDAEPSSPNGSFSEPNSDAPDSPMPIDPAVASPDNADKQNVFGDSFGEEWYSFVGIDRNNLFYTQTAEGGITAEEFNETYGETYQVSLLPLAEGLWYNLQQDEKDVYVVSFAPEGWAYSQRIVAFVSDPKINVAALSRQTIWRGVEVKYDVDSDRNYVIYFVKDGMYYSVCTTRDDDAGDVAHILDSIFCA